MGTISDKLTYLNTTKGKIKDAINLTNANILSEDTFRSYAEKLKLGLVDIINNGTSDLYDNFPKVTGTGTEIALNDTYEAPMEIGLNGNTHQDSYTGKNLLNYNNSNFTPNSTSWFFLDGGTSAYGTNIGDKTNIKTAVVNGETYTISCDLETNVLSLGIVYEDETTIGNMNIKSGHKTYTFTANRDGYAIIRVRQTANEQVKISNIMFEQSSTETSYEPYVGGSPSPSPDYPQEIEVVTGDNTINIHGKNLAKVTNTDIGDTTYSLKISNGLINITTTGSNNSFDLCGGIRTGAWLPNYSVANDYHLTTANQGTYKVSIFNVIANITGTANQNLSICTNKKRIETYITPSGSLSGATVFTLEENEYIKSIYLWTNGATTIEKLQFNLQLEQNPTATEYEPYQSKDYEINLKSKNLFDGELELGGYGSTGAKVDANNNYRNANTISVEPSTIYTFSINGVSQKYVILFYDKNGNFISQNTSLTTGTFTTLNNAYFINFRTFNADFVSDFANLKVQLEENSTATEYEEFYDYKLCKINDYKDKIDKSTGKNLWSLNNTYGNTTTSNKWVLADTDFVIPKGTYTISCNNNNTSSNTFLINFKTVDNEEITNSLTTQKTITFSKDIAKVAIKLSANTTISNIMLNEGSTALPYEPYGEQWYIKKNIGKVVLDGSENWSYISVTQGSLFRSNNAITDEIKNDTYSPLCNYYIGIPYQNYQSRVNNNIYINSTNNFVDVIDNRYTSASDFKTWLSTHNTEVYYVLATPTYEIITNETLINQLEELKKAKSVDDKTFISQINEQLPFILDVSALSKN